MAFTLSKEAEESIIAFRHDIHRHPELPHKEVRTTAKIKEYLAAVPGVEILELPRGNTGAVARIKGALPGGEVALRADIDAISQTEKNDLPWKSEEPGVMHACGHDFHTAALLGAVQILSEHRDTLRGTVDFIFQKAEETTDGMPQMIEEGLLEVIHPTAVFGEHNRPEVAAGKIICHRGSLMAAKTNLLITLTGKGGHGSVPHLTIDPVVAAATLITSLQTIVSRNTDPMDNVVVTVGYVHGGTPDYLVVDTAEVGVSIRAIRDKTMAMALEHLEMLTRHTAEAFGCHYNIDIQEKLPGIDNPEELHVLAKAAATEVVGLDNVVDVIPVMASEDFAVLSHIIPGYFFWIGSGKPEGDNAPWHSPYYEAQDSAMKYAAEVLAGSAMKYLERA
ncbi:MAG: M20 family metallopeptidase [Lachnospiraceae bacterium]|nr:M20 family metallopeptidase [Lachnospiraceae bacterium]